MIDFLNGKLYLNKLYYFRKLEEKSQNNRADEKEALSLICQADDVKLEFNGYQLKDLVGQVEMRNPSMDNKHVLCLFAGATNESNVIEDNIFKKNKLDQIMEDFSISEEFKNLGKYCVLIHNTPEFMENY
ncbi:hypothetical protein OAR97_02540 [Arcobacteraceae bacterium]|nr:hypothetical protein [Arcobacteraceae bacterium]